MPSAARSYYSPWWLLVFPGNSYWRGRISTIDIQVLNCSDQVLLLLKIWFFFNTSCLNKASQILNEEKRFILKFQRKFCLIWAPAPKWTQSKLKMKLNANFGHRRCLARKKRFNLKFQRKSCLIWVPAPKWTKSKLKPK